MKLYRSIGEDELGSILKGSIVQGRYNCKTEHQNSTNEENTCCFFVDEVRWRDKQHQFVIVVDIPIECLSFGIGKYWASKEMKNTKTWTGRNGSELYKIREAYISSYSIVDVKEIYLFGHFAKWVVDKIKSICNENDIVLHDVDCSMLFEENETHFKYFSCGYQTIEDLDNWINSLVVNKDEFVEEIKNRVLKANISFEQARKIQQILRIG